MSNHGETPETRNLPGPTVEEATRQKEDFELRAHEALEAFREKQRPMEILPEEWEAKLVEAKLIDRAREVDSTDLEAYLTALASLQAGAHNINFPRELRPVFVARCDALYVVGPANGLRPA